LPANDVTVGSPLIPRSAVAGASAPPAGFRSRSSWRWSSCRADGAGDEARSASRGMAGGGRLEGHGRVSTKPRRV